MYSDAPRVEINSCRLWQAITESAALGGIPGTTGISRLSLSDSDKAVRALFIKRAKAIGCEIAIDQIGNTFAKLPGRDNTLAPIGMGSHLDTQPNGGRFDGILGVLGALEVLQSIEENGLVTNRPITAINWTNEEGAHFESGCTGSAVWANYLTLEQGHALRTIQGDSNLRTELRRIGYEGSVSADHRLNPLSAHFEIHIEQGPRLERGGHRIGVVSGIQGNRRLKVTVRGEKAHSGSTPMSDRTDALIATSKIVVHVEATGIKYGGFATVGVVECEDSSINCVPGKALFTIDLRHPSGNQLDTMEQSIRAEMKRLESSSRHLHFAVEKIWESPAAIFDGTTMACVEQSALQRFGAPAVTQLISFAGHDSAMTGLRVPTAMIFVPSLDGVSHAPEEYTSPEQCADGVQVLADAVLAYDQLMTEESERNDSPMNMVNEYDVESKVPRCELVAVGDDLKESML